MTVHCPPDSIEAFSAIICRHRPNTVAFLGKVVLLIPGRIVKQGTASIGPGRVHQTQLPGQFPPACRFLTILLSPEDNIPLPFYPRCGQQFVLSVAKMTASRAAVDEHGREGGPRYPRNYAPPTPERFHCRHSCCMVLGRTVRISTAVAGSVPKSMVVGTSTD